jgi:hypothetical protein
MVEEQEDTVNHFPKSRGSRTPERASFSTSPLVYALRRAEWPNKNANESITPQGAAAHDQQMCASRPGFLTYYTTAPMLTVPLGKHNHQYGSCPKLVS